jgi:hypothetical protein
MFRFQSIETQSNSRRFYQREAFSWRKGKLQPFVDPARHFRTGPFSGEYIYMESLQLFGLILCRLFLNFYDVCSLQNYLLRWDEDSINLLEKTLEAQLQTVRTQKSILKARQTRSLKFSPIVTSKIKEYEIFHADFLAACATDGSLRPSIFNQIVDSLGEEDRAIYFPLFTTEFAELLVQHCEQFVRFSLNSDLPPGHERPMILDLMKLDWLNDLLLNRVMNPIGRLLFQDQTSNGDLDWRHGYVVSYAAPDHATDLKEISRSKLVQHTDDSEITLNVCLGRNFEGGDVVMYGLRGGRSCAPTKYHPRPGWALMHVGRQFHEVSSVTKGERFALIVWARSYGAVRGQVCPCCWMNNRDPLKSSCICSSRWN